MRGCLSHPPCFVIGAYKYEQAVCKSVKKQIYA